MEKVTAMDPVKGSIVIVTTASVSSTINISTFLDTQVSLAPTPVQSAKSDLNSTEAYFATTK